MSVITVSADIHGVILLDTRVLTLAEAKDLQVALDNALTEVQRIKRIVGSPPSPKSAPVCSCSGPPPRPPLDEKEYLL